jgi:hypothetical protein
VRAPLLRRFKDPIPRPPISCLERPEPTLL